MQDCKPGKRAQKCRYMIPAATWKSEPYVSQYYLTKYQANHWWKAHRYWKSQWRGGLPWRNSNLGYRLYSHEVSKVISKQNRPLNGKDSSQIELYDWVWFFLLTTWLIRSCLIALPSGTHPIPQDIPHYLLHCMDFFEWIGTVAGPLNGDLFVIGTVLFSHSKIKWVLQHSVQVPGAIVFMLTLPRNTTLSACLTVLWFFHASAHRNHGESWTRLVLRSCFCCIFFHIVFSARTCAARLLSRLVGWIVDLTNCIVLLVSLLSLLLSSSSPFLLLLFSRLSR